MSEATDLLGQGLDILLDQHGVAFTVSGVSGTFSGIADSPIDATALSDGGMREENSLSITFATDAGYTPAHGQRVTCKSANWVVTGIRRENASYVISLTGRNQ